MSIIVTVAMVIWHKMAQNGILNYCAFNTMEPDTLTTEQEIWAAAAAVARRGGYKKLKYWDFSFPNADKRKNV